ncbi:hypothetical protein BD769DRAFT_1646849 [Suillus cothurnatus]|nr:hypothetical protein BD769DRAFT_1646849 [Suillus cothurnatus]
MHVKKFLPYVLTVIFEELSKQSGFQRKTLNNIEEAEEEERHHHLYTTQILADQGSNSSLLLYEKDDSDTDKLKNILHFGYGEASEKSEQLIADAMDQWMKLGNTSSSHTA